MTAGLHEHCRPVGAWHWLAAACLSACLLLLSHCPQHPPTDPPAPSMPCVCATLLQIEKKPYYHVFKLAGFVGFDGDFKG